MASYETVRRLALGHRGVDDGPRLGLAILLRQGVTAWLRAWVLCPRPADPVARTIPSRGVPPLVHTELVQLWVHMVLAHQETTWI